MMSAIRKFNHGRQVTYRYNEIDSIKVFKKKREVNHFIKMQLIRKIAFFEIIIISYWDKPWNCTW